MSKPSRISRFTATATAGLSLAVLTACSTGFAAAAEPSPKPSGQQSKAVQVEYYVRDCMKQKGFKFIPSIPPPYPSKWLRERSGDLATMKRVREKYGFGIFSDYVYGDQQDKESGLLDWQSAANNGPQNAIENALSKTQLKSYEAAKNVCWAQAAKKILNKNVKSLIELREQRFEAILTSLEPLDIEFAKSARAFTNCLKKKGYQVGPHTPQELQDGFLYMDVIKEMHRVTNNEQKPLSADQARPYLKREIKAALDDLECGKDVYPAYRPKMTEIERRLAEEYGFYPVNTVRTSTTFVILRRITD